MSYDDKQLAENRRKAAKTATGLFIVCGVLLVAFIVMVWLKVK